MRHDIRWLVILGGLGVLGLTIGCDRSGDSADDQVSWEALLADGDMGSVASAASTPAATTTPPPRSCSDCAYEPLALWRFDDCNASSTQLADSASSSSIPHPAFRAVGVSCVAGADGLAVAMSGTDDIVYAPDQPDFLFNQGLTVAAWINPTGLAGTQSIVRKRLDGTSAFTLAIDGGKLTFVVHLTSGKLVGVTASIKAKRFTHVAATYDGQQAALYLDGALAAKAKGAGTIAPGAGPIFIGNDASGRELKGTVDSLWLNTRAASAQTVKELTCIRKPPKVKLSPGQTPPEPAATAVPFDLSVTNPNDAAMCPVDTFDLSASSLPFPLSTDTPVGSVLAGPGKTVHVPIKVTALDTGTLGSFSFQYKVVDTANSALQATAAATLVVVAPPTPSQTGCPAAPTAPVVPGGYYVSGNTVCTAAGRAHVFHGVDRSSLEYNSAGDHLSRGDFQLMGSWNANIVRVPLNQDFWLAASPQYDPTYAGTVDSVIAWAEMAGMDVMLDLHWSDRGVLGSCPTGNCQQLMPDANSVTFWSDVATRYKNDGRVMYELYNEPHDVSWSVWKSGGDTGAGWQAVGMQQLYDTIRATGAQSLVLIGGLNWAYDLSGVPTNRIAGYNIVYVTHPYLSGGTRGPDDWSRAWGFLTRTDPVVATEFGDTDDPTCSTDYDSQLIQYANAHFAGWTAWSWNPGGCLGLITDWSATPSVIGALVKAALLGYNDPPASPLRPPGPDISYTFDHGPEGWAFGTYDDPNSQNLALHPPVGETAPTLTISGADGNPSPGALQLTVGFSAFDQTIDAQINLAQPGVNLSGKTLHAMIKLVSGSFPQGALQFHASTGASYAFRSAFFNSAALPVGQWVPFDLDLGAVTSTGFDPTQIVQIGVQFFSGFSSSGQTFQPTGDTVFEIDTVTG